MKREKKKSSGWAREHTKWEKKEKARA